MTVHPCGIGRLNFHCGDYGTGVLAPDGYQETVWEEFFQCNQCQETFSTDDIKDNDKMNALEIIQQLTDGKSIVIRTSDAMEFMRQCQFHGLTSINIHMFFDGQRCKLTDAAQVEQERDRLLDAMNVARKEQP